MRQRADAGQDVRAAGRIGPSAIDLSPGAVQFALGEVREWIDARARADGTLPTAAEWRAMHAAK